MSSKRVYDSALPADRLRDVVSNIWSNRKLIRLLTKREVTTRYRRSFLGVWWALLNPCLTALTLWMVLSGVFKIPVGQLGVPFLVYLFSGILITTFGAQTISLVGGTLVGNEAIIAKIYVPPEVLATGSALATGVNTSIILVPQFVIQVFMGVGIPKSIVFVPLVLVLLLGFGVGVGLLVASLAARFPDTLNIVSFFLQLLTFLTPTFYPVSIVPKEYLRFIESNPFYHFLVLFRSAAYGGNAGPSQSWIFAVVSTIVALILGIRIFGRTCRRVIVKS